MRMIEWTGRPERTRTADLYRVKLPLFRRAELTLVCLSSCFRVSCASGRALVLKAA